MKRDRWHGYIKDYDGATLMEFCIDTRVDYLSTKRVADQQRKAIMQVPFDARPSVAALICAQPTTLTRSERALLRACKRLEGFLVLL
jgi:hypothetical protein